MQIAPHIACVRLRGMRSPRLGGIVCLTFSCSDPQVATLASTGHDNESTAGIEMPPAQDPPSRPGDAARWLVASQDGAYALIQFQDPVEPTTYELSEPEEMATTLAWSPGGSVVAFLAIQDDTPHVILVQVTTDGPQRLGSWKVADVPSKLVFLGEGPLIAWGESRPDYDTGERVYDPSYLVASNEDEPYELGGLFEVEVSKDGTSAVALGEELVWLRRGQPPVHGGAAGPNTFGLSPDATKLAIVTSDLDPWATLEGLTVVQYQVPADAFERCEQPATQPSFPGPPPCPSGEVPRFAAPVWSPAGDGFMVPLSFSQDDRSKNLHACSWLTGATVESISGIALNYFAASDAVQTEPQACVSTSKSLLGRTWNYLSDGRLYRTEFVPGESADDDASNPIESRVYVHEPGSFARAEPHFTLRGYVQHMEPIDNEQALTAVAYDRATNSHVVYHLDISRSPHQEATQTSAPQLLLETERSVSILEAEPDGAGLLIGVGGNVFPIGKPDDVPNPTYNMHEEEIEYFLFADPSALATPLENGLRRPTWVADGSGVVGSLDDTIVYIPKDTPEHRYRIANTDAWVAWWTP